MDSNVRHGSAAAWGCGVRMLVPPSRRLPTSRQPGRLRTFLWALHALGVTPVGVKTYANSRRMEKSLRQQNADLLTEYNLSRLRPQRRQEHRRRYRGMRHVARILMIGFIVHVRACATRSRTASRAWPGPCTASTRAARPTKRRCRQWKNGCAAASPEPYGARVSPALHRSGPSAENVKPRSGTR